MTLPKGTTHAVAGPRLSIGGGGSKATADRGDTSFAALQRSDFRRPNKPRPSSDSVRTDA